MLVRMAWRNILRNRRRSVATIFALAIGATAMLLFGGFVASIFYGAQTNLFSQQGHIHIYAKGYMAYGAVEPENYIISNYQPIIDFLRKNEMLASPDTIITPQVRLSGIAGVMETDNSKLFTGLGIVPEDLDRMRQWDGWRLGLLAGTLTGLADKGDDAAIVGFGMARMLGLCHKLDLSDCQDPPQKNKTDNYSAAEIDLPEEIGGLDSRESTDGNKEGVLLNLLAASNSGLPNIETIRVLEAQKQGVRAVDDMYVLLNFNLARQLVFGDEFHATQIVVQIEDAARLEDTRVQIENLLSDYFAKYGGNEYEVLAITDVDQTFSNVLSMFSFIFGVVSLFLGIVTAAAIANTINMSVMERVGEIGTIRALGFRRNFITKMFLTESLMLSILGLITATIATAILSGFINASGLSWTPPSNSTPLLVHLLVFKNFTLIAAVSVFNIILAILASLAPAIRAGRMSIIKALNYV